MKSSSLLLPLFLLFNHHSLTRSQSKVRNRTAAPVIGSRGDNGDLNISQNSTLVLDERVQSKVVLGDAATFENITPEEESEEVLPTVFIALLVRNKAHTLPYFLTLLEGLDYPKDRIALWIRSDHNEDLTPEILTKWARKIDNLGKYHSISTQIVDSPPFRQSDQGKSAVKWSEKRFRHLIRLKEEALRVAKKVWADYIWFLDADVFIVNNSTLRHLIGKNKPIVAPLLISGGLYSNFWGGMENYYYVRTEEYKEILHRKKVGCFPVPNVHSAVLLSLRIGRVPDFRRVNESVPEDDMITFATNAQRLGVPMEICNDLEYGAVLSPLTDEDDLARDDEQLLNLRAEIAAYWESSMNVSEDLLPYAMPDPVATTVGFEQVYLINLKRRPDRLAKMQNALKILGIDYQVIEATDGRNLSPEKLVELGIEPLANYRDPYSKRVMTYGEIGCFLSHYRAWQDMLKNHYKTGLILEDDIRFEPFFIYQLQRLFEEAGNLKLDWDLMYLGRKRSVNAKEPFVEGSNFIVEADYSYWTLGYGITAKGIRKLLEPQPFKKLVPLDEYLPIMFDRHANKAWAESFPIRNLKAFSAEPLLLYPTHYTGEMGYVSDTEESSTLSNFNCSTQKEEL